MKKIDAHAHIGQFGSWAGVEGTPDVLLSFMDEYEIEKTVLCAKDHNGNEGVLEAWRQHPDRFWPLVYVNPTEGAEECRRKIERYVDQEGFKGIKMNPLRHAFVADDEMVDPVMEEAEKRGIPVFIHSGHPPYSLPWSIALLAERFPKVKVVMMDTAYTSMPLSRWQSAIPTFIWKCPACPWVSRSSRLMRRWVLTGSCSVLISRSIIRLWRSRRY